MTNTTRLSLLAVILLATFAQARDKPFNPNKEAWVVLGVMPGDYIVEISVGKVDGSRWKRAGSEPYFSGASQGGYIVARVPANTDLAITRIRAPRQHRRPWTWCRTSFTPLLNAAPGHVVYFTDVTYRWPDDADPWFTTAVDFERARAYVDANYPDLRGRLEAGAPRTVRPLTPCDANGPEPIVGFNTRQY